MQLFLNGLVTGTGYGLVAVSFALIYNTSHFFNFSHAATYTAAAYVAFALLAYAQLNAPVGVLGAVIFAAGLGGLCEISLFRPLRRRRSTPVVLLLASLGVLIVLQNCISLIFGEGLRALPGLTVRAGYLIADARVTGPQICIILCSFGLSTLMALALRYTKTGRMLRAVGNDKELSDMVGIDSEKVILIAFVAGSTLAGAAAVLIAWDTGLRPTMGFNALLFGVVGMVIGGVGKTSAAFWGGLVIGFAQQIAGWMLPSKWQDAIVFMILIGFLLLRPQGLLGLPLKKSTV